MKQKKFSTELEDWFKHDHNKTLGELIDIFGTRSFGIIIFLMMIIPSLPIPTGGITHILLLPIAYIVAVEMIIGRRSIWLPKIFKKIVLKKYFDKKVIPFVIRRIKWAEKYTRPRLSDLIEKNVIRTLIGIILFVFISGANFSIPFSGLDTLPSLGCVLIGLGIIFGDIALIIGGTIVGTLGMALIIGASGAIVLFFNSIF